MDLKAARQLPGIARDVLAQADRFELFSLEPAEGPTREPGHFHNWRVLGSTVVTPAVGSDLLAALERGVAESRGVAKDCFIPRHGIRAQCGDRSVALVICFECARIHVYVNGAWHGDATVTHGPQPTFDRVLSDAAVPLAQA